MRLKIKDNIIYNELDVAIGAVFEDASDGERGMLEASGEMAEAVVSFVDNINSGTHKPRAAAKEFERIIDKYNLQIQ
jgi:hypothetical protein